MPKKLLLFEPDFGDKEILEVISTLKKGWVAQGEKVLEFENRLAHYLGVKYAIATNSGTAALHLAYCIAGIGPGDEVVVPSLTFCATANAVIYCGATPVFADINSSNDWTISSFDVSKKLTSRTRAVVAMHYAGFGSDMVALRGLCKGRNIYLIEDAAHALGGKLDNQALGTIGDFGCFSFYSNKIITTAEGGLLVTNNKDAANRARCLRSHGMTATAHDRVRGASGYDIKEVGYNYRLDDFRASLGLAQLDRLDHSLEQRISLVDRYRKNLAMESAITVPLHGNRGKSANYIFPVLINLDIRDQVRKSMENNGIQTSIHYTPVHQLSPYLIDGFNLPIVESISTRILTLPLYPAMTIDDVDLVCNSIRQAISSAI